MFKKEEMLIITKIQWW